MDSLGLERVILRWLQLSVTQGSTPEADLWCERFGPGLSLCEYGLAG